MKDESYLVPNGIGRSELTEKRSRFLGQVLPCASEEEALEHLRLTREAHRDASHTVYCYRIHANSIMRYSDDGEPGGTAGMPCLQIFMKQQIEDFCCTVTRWFGGTLLGTGGLARAYSETARLALENAGPARLCPWRSFTLPCDYGAYRKIRTALEAEGYEIADAEFGERVLLTLLAPAERAERLEPLVRELTFGSGKLTPGETMMRKILLSGE